MLPLFWSPGPLIPRLTLGPRLYRGKREPREAFGFFHLRPSGLLGRKCVNCLVLNGKQMNYAVFDFMFFEIDDILIFHCVLRVK